MGKRLPIHWGSYVSYVKQKFQFFICNFDRNRHSVRPENSLMSLTHCQTIVVIWPIRIFYETDVDVLKGTSFSFQVIYV